MMFEFAHGERSGGRTARPNVVESLKTAYLSNLPRFAIGNETTDGNAENFGDSKVKGVDPMACPPPILKVAAAGVEPSPLAPLPKPAIFEAVDRCPRGFLAIARCQGSPGRGAENSDTKTGSPQRSVAPAMFPKACYLTCLWPGLPELWFRGRLASLPIALAAAAALNLVLIFRYVFPEVFPAPLVSMAFYLGILLWGSCVLQAIRELPKLLVPAQVSERPDRFVEAQTAFVRGQWDAAERLLHEVLAIESRDPPALLMLCSVYRHTGRLDHAADLLRETQRLEACDAWQTEIDTEWLRYERFRQHFDEANEDAAAAPNDTVDPSENTTDPSEDSADSNPPTQTAA